MQGTQQHILHTDHYIKGGGMMPTSLSYLNYAFGDEIRAVLNHLALLLFVTSLWMVVSAGLKLWKVMSAIAKEKK
jgi:sensor histidine kinase YesM